MNALSKPKVTVYILNHNYARFLPQAIESVEQQLFADWELLLIDDGSDDESASIMEAYQQAHPDRTRLFTHHPARGLPACANLALREAHGEYIIRLDADDYFDEAALLVLATYLDQHPEIGLVYPNYYYVNAAGDVLGVEDRKRIGSEVDLLDLPAHGAGTLVRKRLLKAVGGYDESYDRQDGYDLWLRFVNRYPVANVSTALFYYRQHGDNLTRDNTRLLETRQRIKRDAVKRLGGETRPRILGIIPAKNTYPTLPNVVLREMAGKPLIDYSLETALAVEALDRVVVSTDDQAVSDYVTEHYPEVLALSRPDELSSMTARLSQIVAYTVEILEAEHDYYPDAVVLLSVHSPLREAEHITAAIDTLILYPVDSVLSVYEDYTLHYLHAQQGLVPANPGMHHHVRLEREALYVDNGAVKAAWRESITPASFLGERVGHLVMPAEISFQIKSEFDFSLIESLMLRNRSASG
jgi:CMP-N-acetylneuraminic acid synthetase/glycosyltransferase involved in cell wall biosynthesis